MCVQIIAKYRTRSEVRNNNVVGSSLSLVAQSVTGALFQCFVSSYCTFLLTQKMPNKNADRITVMSY